MIKRVLPILFCVLLTGNVFARSVDEGNYDAIIQAAHDQYPTVDMALIKAVIKQESGFVATAGSLGCSGPYSNPATCSGAYGLMQLMPETASGLGLSPGDRGDPRKNIFTGTKYLSQLLHMYNGDTVLALAAYNAGPGNVKKYNGVPPFNETIGYIRNIAANYIAYGGSNPINLASVPPRGSGGSGGRPPAPSGGGVTGNPSILRLADGARILSDFEAYLGQGDGFIKSFILGTTLGVLFLFASIQVWRFFTESIVKGNHNDVDETRLAGAAFMSFRTLTLVSILFVFIANAL